jgi:hypothetical protein
MALTLRYNRIRCQRMTDDDYGFPVQLVRWLRDRDHAALINALSQLRMPEADPEEVIAILAASPAVYTTKASWDLWEALLEGREDTEALLAQHLSPEVLSAVRYAFWGDDRHPSRRARLKVMHLRKRPHTT